MKLSFLLILGLLLSTFLFFCSNPQAKFVSPENLKFNSAQVALGRALFFERTLSDDNSIACSDCHNPAAAFSDTVSLSKGIYGKRGKRNAPALINLNLKEFFFHDGRAKTLTEQALGPLNNQDEMGHFKLNFKKIQKSEFYQKQFKSVFAEDISEENLLIALVEFEKSLITNKSAFDLFLKGDSSALSEDQKLGFQIFNEKANCVSCHFGPNLSDNLFHNIAFFEKNNPNSDKGLFEFTKDNNDLGKFATPSLRNLALTAPYFHDGRVNSLEEVINLYNKPMPMGPGDFKDSLIKPIHLTNLEKFQLQQFLLSLTDTNSIKQFTNGQFTRQRYNEQNYKRERYDSEYFSAIYRSKSMYVLSILSRSLFYKELLAVENMDISKNKTLKELEIAKKYLDTLSLNNNDIALFNTKERIYSELLETWQKSFDKRLEIFQKKLKTLSRKSNNYYSDLYHLKTDFFKNIILNDAKLKENFGDIIF